MKMHGFCEDSDQIFELSSEINNGIKARTNIPLRASIFHTCGPRVHEQMPKDRSQPMRDNCLERDICSGFSFGIKLKAATNVFNQSSSTHLPTTPLRPSIVRPSCVRSLSSSVVHRRADHFLGMFRRCYARASLSEPTVLNGRGLVPLARPKSKGVPRATPRALAVWASATVAAKPSAAVRSLLFLRPRQQELEDSVTARPCFIAHTRL